MIETIIKGIVLAIVLVAVYMVVGALVTAASAPAWITLVVGALLVLGFCVWLLKVFNISF